MSAPALWRGLLTVSLLHRCEYLEMRDFPPSVILDVGAIRLRLGTEPATAALLRSRSPASPSAHDVSPRDTVRRSR